jgi:hypothetical protein
MAINKTVPWLIILVVLGVAVAWYLYQRPAPEVHPSVASLPKMVEQGPPAQPQYPMEALEPAQGSQAEPVPPLAESDEAVIRALGEWLDAGTLDALLVREQIIPRVVASIDSLDSRELAPLVMPVRPPPGAFQASAGDVLTINPANFERYAPYANLVRAVPVEGAVAFYRRHYPLFQQAYEDLGHPDAYFNDRLVAVIDHLLATPVPEQPPVLLKPETAYVFEDEGLEALTAGQKILLRIGPEQAALVRERLRAMRGAITREGF